MTADEMRATASEVCTPGAPLKGGFFVGRIRLGDAIYSIVVAPKADGDQAPTPWNKTRKVVAGAQSFNDGLANTEAMASAGSALAKWARALRLGGFDDWYLPSRDELELCYRHLKPGTEENYVWRSGDNPSSVPAGYPYTTTDPAQTTIEAFRIGGAEAFDENWYWTSTQSADEAEFAWYQRFLTGGQLTDPQDVELRARAVRREPEEGR